jgi:hypothetical protein
MLLIDPAHGWMYGFPKPYDNPDNLPIDEWLVVNGYPEKEAKLVAENKLWCRYFGGTYEELLSIKDIKIDRYG